MAARWSSAEDVSIGVCRIASKGLLPGYYSGSVDRFLLLLELEGPSPKMSVTCVYAATTERNEFECTLRFGSALLPQPPPFLSSWMGGEGRRCAKAGVGRRCVVEEK